MVPCMRNGERGATYLLLLFALALLGASMAAVGSHWAVAAQREREAELLFRGREFSAALASWRDTAAPGEPSAPLQLEELRIDERRSSPQHHLRRLYSDPFTGRPDWVVLRDARHRIVGVHSLSRQPALRRIDMTLQHAEASLRDGADAAKPSVGDWLFTPEPPLPPTTLLKRRFP